MKFSRYLFVLLALLASTSCASYEEQRKLEVALAESVNRFHEQLNNEQFHEIYSQTNPTLQKSIDETAFTNQLKIAHQQLGTISGKKSIIPLTSRGWNDVQWARTFGGEQKYFHVETPDSEMINANERFEWRVENDQPKLASYEFRFICKKPCTVGIEIR